MREGKDTMMDRQEFMRRLEQLLLFVPIQEKEEALQYYNDYFEDAGPEKEQEVIESLGSPEQLAENIKRDINQSHYGAEPDKVEPGKEIMEYHPVPEIVEEPYDPSTNKWNMPTWLIIVIVVCAIPLLGGLIGTVVGAVGGVLALWFGMLVTFGAIGLACTVAGIIVIVAGGIACVLNAYAGLGIIGVGLIVMAIGVLGILLESLLIGKWTPAIVNGLKKVFQKIMNLGKERM